MAKEEAWGGGCQILLLPTFCQAKQVSLRKMSRCLFVQLNGDSWACRAAADLLQSLLCAIRVRTVVLHLPGVSRFLLEERGQAILQDLERSFCCAFGLEHLQWLSPETQVPTLEGGCGARDVQWGQRPECQAGGERRV